MSSSGGGTEEVPFEATIDASSLLQGLQQITDAFTTLNTTVETSAQKMSDGFTAVGDAFTSLQDNMVNGFTIVSDALDYSNDQMDKLVSTTDGLKGSIDGLNGPLNTLVSRLDTSNNSLVVATNNLHDMDLSLLRLETELQTLNDGMDTVATNSTTMADSLRVVADNTNVLEDGFLLLDDDLSQVIGRLDDANTNLDVMGRTLGAMSGQLTTVNDNLDIANTRLAALGTVAMRTNTLLDDTNSVLRAMDGSLSNVSVNSDQMVTSLQTIIDKLDVLNTSLGDLGTKLTEANDKLKTLDEDAKTAGEGGMTSLIRGLGHVPATMMAWAIFNTASNWLHGFISNAIGGNATLERFHATLQSVTGSSGAADKLITWAQQFGQMIPDTTQNLEAATVKIASLGLNAQQIMPSLADIAGVMHVDLPTASRAFADAFHGRWMMLQNDLNISKEQLIQYGLQIGKHNKIIESSLAPAIEAYAKAKFPDGLKQAMATYSGQMTNLTDKTQLLAMAFGKPVFKEFESLMFQLIMFLTAHFDGIRNVVTIIGEGLAKAMGFVLQPLMNLIQLLPTHHALWTALAGLLGGTVVGVLASIAVMFVLIISKTLLFAAPFAALGLVIGVAVAAFKDAYAHSAALRFAIQNLRDAVHHLLAAFLPLGSGALSGVKGALEGVWNALIKWLQSPQVIEFIWKITDGINHLATMLQNAHRHGQNFGTLLHDIGQHFHSLLGFLLPILGMLLPLGGGIGAVVGLLAGGKAGLIKDIWKPIGDILGGLAKGGFGLLPGLIRAVLDVFMGAPGAIGGFVRMLGRELPQVIPFIIDFFKTLPAFVRMAATAFSGLASGALSGVVGLFRLLGGHVSFALGFLKGLWSSVGGLSGIFSTLSGALSGVLPFILSLGARFQSVASGGLGVFRAIMMVFTKLILPAFTGGLTEAAGALGGLIAPALPFIGVALLIAGVLLSIGVAFVELWKNSAGFRAMIGQVGKEFLSIGGTITSSLLPVWHQLQNTLKQQLMPAWKALQHAFNEMKPVLVLVGGIIIGIVLVALGLLIGIIKGVIAALGPLLSGIIMVFGGIAQVIAGVVEVISAIIGGLVRIIVDLATGHGGRVKQDALNMWNDLKDGVVNIILGLWTTLSGIWKATWDALIALLGGFIKGVFDFFTHLFEKLVGHSIITDGMALIVKVISDGLTKALLFVANFILGALQHLADIAKGIPVIGGFISNLLGMLAALVNLGVMHIIRLKDQIVHYLQLLPAEATSVGQNIISSLGSALTSGIGHLRDIASTIGQNIMHGFKNMLGIKSPSKVFSDYGVNIMEGLGQGLQQKDVSGALTQQIAKLRQAATGQIGQIPFTVATALSGANAVTGSLGTGLATATATNGVAPNAAYANGGPPLAGSSTENHYHLHVEGDATFGFQMMDPTSRALLLGQIAQEWSHQVDQQVLQKNGYSGYH